jgi:hypothetical protein
MSNTMVFTLLGVDKLSPAFRTAGAESGKAGRAIGSSIKGAEGNVTKSTGRIHKGLSNTFSGIKGMIAPAIAAFSVLGAIGIAKSSIQTFQDTGIEVIKLQRIAGGTAEQMSRLREAAVLSGISVDTLTKGLRLGSKALSNTEGNTKATAKMVALLGFNYQDAHGKVLPWAALLPKIADRFKSMPPGVQKTALAMKIFGRSGVDMIPFLNKGSAGIRALEAQSDKLGTTMSGKSLSAIVAYRTQQRQFAATMLGVKLAIGGALLPTLTKVGTTINSFIGQMRSGKGVGGAFVGVIRDLFGAFTATLSPLSAAAKFLWEFKTPLAIASLVIAAVFIPHLIAMGVAATVSGAETAAIWLLLKRDAITGAIAHSWAVVRIVAGWAIMGVQSIIQAGRMAVAWVIAMGPIAWVVVAIAALVALVIWKWKAISTWTVKTFGGMANTVKNFFVGLPAKVGNVAKLLLRKGQDLFEGFKAGIWAVAKGVGAWILRAPVVKVVAPWLYAGVWLVIHGRKLMTGFLSGVWAVAKSIGTWMNNWVIQPNIRAFVKAGTWLYQRGSQVVTGLKNGIWAIARTLYTWTNQYVVQPVWRVFVSAGSWLYQRGRQVLIGLRSGLWNIASTIGSWVWTNVVRRVVGQFGTAGKWLYSMGQSVIGGLLSGIWNKMRGVGAWIKTQVVDPIIANVRKFFGIASPSKVMANLGSALAVGLFKGLGSVNMAKAIGKIFGSMPTALGRIVNKGLISLASLPKKALSALSSVGSAIGGIIGGIGSNSLPTAGGSGVARWRAVALQALQAAGAPAIWINSLLRRMNQESGGNPNAINLTDSNARAGHPSQGLMQTIPGTFNAYAGPYRSRGILDPFANIYAAIKYANARYGVAPRGWDRPGGYKDGGWLMPGKLGYNETSKPEAVFNQAQLAMMGGGSRRLHPDDLAAIASSVSRVDVNLNEGKLTGLIDVRAGALDGAQARSLKRGRR